MKISTVDCVAAIKQQFSIQQPDVAATPEERATTWKRTSKRGSASSEIVRTFRATTIPWSATVVERNGAIDSVSFSDETPAEITPETIAQYAARARASLSRHYDEKYIRKVLQYADPRKWRFGFVTIDWGDDEPVDGVFLSCFDGYDGGNWEAALFPFIDENFSEASECQHEPRSDSPYRTKEQMAALLTKHGMRYDPSLNFEDE